MAIVNGIDEKTRLHVWTDNYDEQKAFGKVVWASPAGQQYLRDFEHSDENLQIVFAAVETLYLNVHPVTTDMFIVALKAVMDAGDIQRKAPEPAPPAAGPEGQRTLTEPQQRWSEYRQFSESHSMAECRARARTDAGYASFMRKNYEREGLQHGEGTVLNGVRETPSSDTNPELVAFVQEYLKTPSEQVRKLRRSDTNPLGFKKYNEMLALAASKNLI